MFNINNIINNIFLYKIYKNIKNSLNKEKLTILYSYGIDSNTLFNSIINIIGKQNIILIHVNHNISKLDKIYKKKCIKMCVFYKIKLFIINLNNNLFFIKENKIRIKREKLYKIFSKKFDIKSFWNGYQYNDNLETIYIYNIKNIKKKIKNIFYKNKKHIIQKKKPLKNIKKNFLKNFSKNNWIEEYWNLKKKNIRNIIRINILPKIKFYKRCGWVV